MRHVLRTRFGALAIGAVVFATVFAAAAALDVTQSKTPQSGTGTATVCDSNGVSVAYSYSGTDITAIDVTGNDCATGNMVLTTEAGYFFVEGNSQAHASTATFTLAATDGGTATPISAAAFAPGAITVTLLP